MTNHDEKLTKFAVNGEIISVNFVETQTVKEGVECDIYTFEGDDSKDLAIVRVTKGFKTPSQRVVLGTKTIEGFVSGKGILHVFSDDKADSCEFGPALANEPVIVLVGQVMQWHADADSDLVFYEICEPPYQDGRFEDL